MLAENNKRNIRQFVRYTNNPTTMFPRWFQETKSFCSKLHTPLWTFCNNNNRYYLIDLDPDTKPKDYDQHKHEFVFDIELVIETAIEEQAFINLSAAGKEQCKQLQQENMEYIQRKYLRKNLKHNKIRDIPVDIRSSRDGPVSIVSDIFAKISLFFSIKNCTLNINHNDSNIILIKSKCCLMQSHITKKKSNKNKSLSTLYDVRSILTNCNDDNIKMTSHSTIFNWVWSLKVYNREQQQQKQKLVALQKQVQNLHSQLNSLTNNLSAKKGVGGSYADSTDSSMININVETNLNTVVNDPLNLIKSLITREHSELFDFNKIINISCSLEKYVSNSDDSINKIKECYDLFGFLTNPTKIIEMLVFKDAYDIGLRDLRSLFNSNFSRSNKLHSTLLKTINKYKLRSIQCLKQKILTFDVGKFDSMFENWYKNHDWNIFQNKTKGSMSCVNSSKFKTLTFCRNNRKDNNSTCETHCHGVDKKATNLFALEPPLSPSLESIDTDLIWLLLFEPKLFDDMNIDSKDVNTVIRAILNCCYQFIDSKACDIICTDRFDDCGDYLEMLAVTLQYIAYERCLYLIMNIQEKRYDWTKNGIASKRNSVENLCKFLNANGSLRSDNIIYNGSLMNYSKVDDQSKHPFDLEKLGIFQHFVRIFHLIMLKTVTRKHG